MVSLDPNFGRSVGARFLTDTTNTMDNEQDELIDPVISTEDADPFKRLKTIPHICVHTLISVAISVVGIILAVVWEDEKRCKAYFIMLYLRGAFWFITFIMNHIIKMHHDNLRMNGYHEFYRQTNVHKEIPLYVVSLWNTVILIIQSLIHDYYGTHFWEQCLKQFLSPIVYMTAFSLTETFVLACVNGSYIAKVVKFNKTAPSPDALRGHLTTGIVGFIQPGANTTALLEAQADLIAYYKEQNFQLNVKLLQLNLQNQSLLRV